MLEALERGQFDIEAREFRYTSGKRDPVVSTNSRASMRADRGTVDFGLHIYRGFSSCRSCGSGAKIY